MRHNYLVLFLATMLLLMISKRVFLSPAFRTKIPKVIPSRNFFTSTGSKTQSNHNNYSQQDASNDSSTTLSQASVTSSFSAYNYDALSFDKLSSCEVAVAFQLKNREKSNLFLRRQEKSPAELSPTGEDNLFVSSEKKGYIALGVADGVGGWAEAGYDSSAISRELCHSMKNIFESCSDLTKATPLYLLSQAFSAILSSPKVEIGGTTACLGVLTPERKLHVANLGDSWCGVFRDYKLVEETNFQTHNFNTPYQLAKIPDEILQAAERQGKRYIIDTPAKCDSYEWQLQKDDVILFATDGVTDNIVPQDTELFIRDQHEKKLPLTQIASNFVSEVVKVSKDQNFPSAFAQELSRLTGQRYLGGKEDDITVVMVRVL